jgi:hypothetical protein
MKRQTDEYHFDDVMEDGRTLRVPLLLCDAVPAEWAFDARDHQPGYRLSDDAAALDARRDALDARDAMIRAQANAWRDAGRRPAREDEPPDPPAVMPRPDDPFPEESNIDAAQARRDAAYAASKRDQSNAWRTVVGPGPGTVGASPECIGAGPGRRS